MFVLLLFLGGLTGKAGKCLVDCKYEVANRGSSLKVAGTLDLSSCSIVQCFIRNSFSWSERKKFQLC